MCNNCVILPVGGYQLSQLGIRHGFQDVWSLFLIIDADASQLSFYLSAGEVDKNMEVGKREYKIV